MDSVLLVLFTSAPAFHFSLTRPPASDNSAFYGQFPL